MHQRSLRSLRFVLIAVAVILSAFNGWLSILTVLIFSSKESMSLWIAIVLPAFAWIAALGCIKFPRGGLILFWSILGAAVILCANSTHRPVPTTPHYIQCAMNLRFSLLAGVLLALAVVSGNDRRSVSAQV
jgi:hypothetical protein